MRKKYIKYLENLCMQDNEMEVHLIMERILKSIIIWLYVMMIMF